MKLYRRINKWAGDHPVIWWTGTAIVTALVIWMVIP